MSNEKQQTLTEVSSCIDIYERAKNIRFIGSLDKKIATATDILKNTDIVKCGNALDQFDYDIHVWHNEENYLKKYLEYRLQKSIYAGVDCDVSILCIVMYTLLNRNLNKDHIKKQCSGKYKYEIKTNDRRFKGDTLTSALHLLKLYLGCLWRRIDNDEQRKKINKDFYELFYTIDKITGVPKVPTGNWRSYYYEHSDIIWNAMDKEAQEFFRSYNMFGNYMCIPGNSYHIIGRTWTSFNMSRSNYGKWDTVDTLLAKIYGYYKHSDVSYLEAIFTAKKTELAEETAKWLAGFGTWDNFVEINALESFVDKNTLIPISLKIGVPIPLEKTNLKVYNAIPQTYDEFLTFFSEVSERIKQRNEFISSKIHSRATETQHNN